MLVRMNDEYSDQIQLWLLRILNREDVLARFLKKDGFADDDVARALDLTKWIDSEAVVRQLLSRVHFGVRTKETAVTEDGSFKFKHEAILREMQKKHAQLEQRKLSSQSYLEQNCRNLEATFGLNLAEVNLLKFVLLKEEIAVLDDCIDIVKVKSQREYLTLIATTLKLSLKDLSYAVRPEGVLRSIGLIELSKSNSKSYPTLDFFNRPLSTKLVFSECGINQLMRDVACSAPLPTLSYTDYPHMKEMLGYVRVHVRNALRERRTGVNLFFYGLPGTGKSELSRVIAREMRAELYEVSSEDDKGCSTDAKERLGALVKAQAYLGNKRALLVFDEAEDVFRASSFFSQSVASERKAWVNRMLESNRVPTIWISNSVRGLDPAFTRRFDFVCEIPTPPRSQRLKTLRRICGRSVSAETLQQLAQSADIAPAVVARAKSVAEGLVQTHGVSQVEPAFNQLIRHTLKAQGHDLEKLRSGSAAMPKVYSLGYLNPSTSIDGLDGQLRKHPSCRLCLYGPPGTGKTTLGYWLSERLERPLHIKKASDLLGPYVGQTEREIARAFDDAKEEQAILMIDEVDSFLQERSQVGQSWEVTQVNEMLTQIERFEGIFIASTNLMDGIDAAALRRFDLKLKFDYLFPEQSTQLMESYATELALGKVRKDVRSRLEGLANCTPGDFANAARQHRFRNFESAEQFAVAVEEECSTKADRGLKRMGF